jgi:hypothetical protein
MNKNIAQVGKATQFPNNDPTKGGRKPKIYTQIKKLGYGKDDIKACFGELMFYTSRELQEIIEDDSKPIITEIVAKALLEASKDGNMSKIKEILEHSIGKASQSVDLKTTDDTSTKVTYSYDFVMRKKGEGLG